MQLGARSSEEARGLSQGKSVQQCLPLRSDLVELLAGGLPVLAEAVGSGELGVLVSITLRGVRR